MRAPQWSEIELVLATPAPPAEPYMAVDVEVAFRHDDGTELVRPAFWDGRGTWRVRFASPIASGLWRWSARSTPALAGIDGAAGELSAVAADGEAWRRRGLLRMATGGRTVERADGSPWLLVADTTWALPWRATRDQCREWAALRCEQGFTATLLMSFQPDLVRPERRERGAVESWDQAFDDLLERRLTRLRPEYFRELDALCDILLDHRIVPVWQPGFHGYGWRGGPVAGQVVPAADYARYCRYLVARYGARPALWLVGADGQGSEATIAAGGAEVERCDAYRQPAGIHYAPHASNREHQAAAWLDFQWCQTGHAGEHKPERVAEMWGLTPPKAIANGEPTYERMGHPDRASGWWQGDEAWRNLCAGGTMGVVYGAGSLWQWRQATSERDQPWCCAKASTWADALRFPGAAHVGLLGRLLEGIPLAGCAPDWRCTYGRPALLDPGKLFLVYLHDGGPVQLLDARIPARWRAVDLISGAIVASGETNARPATIDLPSGSPLVVICLP